MVYFIRHGESEANKKGLFAGQRDNSELTELGIKEAKELAQKIKERGIIADQIIHSPLKRASHTAEILAKELHLPHTRLITDQRWEEYDMGAFTGTPIHPITSAELTSHPEAENPNTFRTRILEAIEDAEKRPGTTLVVSHAGVGRMLLAIRRKIDPMHFYDIQGYANGEIVQLVGYNKEK